MARIRTIKPEFWTDETIVKLPFVARLLFIGMWNFADDSGALEYSPDRIKLQILPAESDCDITDLIDLLAAAGLVDYWVTESGTEAITIRGWEKHQKIDNPSRKTIIREDYRKKAIPTEERVAVARKYGCSPGGSVDAACYYCGMPGKVHWWMGQNGRPSRWITLSELEFDHFVSEHSGGSAASGNIVLACRSCNRGKREFDPHQFFATKNPSIAIDRASESSPLDQGKDQGRDQGSRIKEGSASESPDGDPPPSAEPKEKKPKREKRPDLTFDQWLATIPDDADIVPVDDPLWSWWETQRLPFEWRPLAWAAFEQKYTGKPKRYADWLAVFRQAVREDWLKVWRVMPDGSNVLTTVGEQLRRAA